MKDEVLVVAASVATKKKQAAYSAAILDVMDQMPQASTLRSAVWTAASDPCLQVADYCSWAIQRKWELGDVRSYKLISSKISSEYDLFRVGRTYYY